MGPTNDLNVFVIDSFASKIQSGYMPDCVAMTNQMMRKPLVIKISQSPFFRSLVSNFPDSLDSIGATQVCNCITRHFTIFYNNILVVQI
jgi:hypothetical protein